MLLMLSAAALSNPCFLCGLVAGSYGLSGRRPAARCACVRGLGAGLWCGSRA
jgi:hypothetical protein